MSDKTKIALQLVLDQVDYTKGACRPNEMVGAVLSTEIIQIAREALKPPPQWLAWRYGDVGNGKWSMAHFVTDDRNTEALCGKELPDGREGVAAAPLEIHRCSRCNELLERL